MLHVSVLIILKIIMSTLDLFPNCHSKSRLPCPSKSTERKAHRAPLSQSAALHAELSLWFCNILAKSQLLKEIRWCNLAPLTVPSWHLFYCFMYCGIKRDYLLIIPCSLRDRWGGGKRIVFYVLELKSLFWSLSQNDRSMGIICRWDMDL